MHKSSSTLEESKENAVFQFEMHYDKNTFQMSDSESFKINKIWVENKWMYDCVDNKAVIKKDSSMQVVLDGNYSGVKDNMTYLLTEPGSSSGVFIGSILSFDYKGQNTFTLTILNDKMKVTIDTLRFRIQK